VEPLDSVRMRWPELLTEAPVMLAPGFPAQLVKRAIIKIKARKGPRALRKDSIFYLP
jgi:hypothetical protein